MLVRLALGVLLPLLDARPQPLLYVRLGWAQLTYYLEKGHRTELNKARLALRYIGSLSIAQKRYFLPRVQLVITLVKKLLKELVRL